MPATTCPANVPKEEPACGQTQVHHLNSTLDISVHQQNVRQESDQVDSSIAKSGKRNVVSQLIEDVFTFIGNILFVCEKFAIVYYSDVS